MICHFETVTSLEHLLRVVGVQTHLVAADVTTSTTLVLESYFTEDLWEARQQQHLVVGLDLSVGDTGHGVYNGMWWRV